MDTQHTSQYVAAVWEESILPALAEYIRIPNKSPAFAPDWQALDPASYCSRLSRSCRPRPNWLARKSI